MIFNICIYQILILNVNAEMHQYIELCQTKQNMAYAYYNTEKFNIYGV